MYNETDGIIKLSWDADTVFRRISDETLYNSRTIEDGDLPAMTDDERYFFNNNIDTVLVRLYGYFRRIVPDHEILFGCDTDSLIWISFRARVDRDNIRQFSQSDLAALDIITDRYLRNIVLYEWYVSVRQNDLVAYYTSQLTVDDARLQGILFRFKRPAYNGAGYSYTIAPGDEEYPGLILLITEAGDFLASPEGELLVMEEGESGESLSSIYLLATEDGALLQTPEGSIIAPTI